MELQYSKKKKFEPNMQLKWQEKYFFKHCSNVQKRKYLHIGYINFEC